MSGRFVAPITTTSFSSSRPSSSVSSWLTTRSVTCESELAPRVGATASSSSNKMIVGETCLARRNVSRTPFFRLAYPLAEQLRPLYANKVGFAFRRDRLRKERLPRPWRPEEQHPFWRPRVDAAKCVREFYRPFNGFYKLLFCRLKAADVLPFYIRRFNEHLAHRGRFNVFLDVCEVHFINLKLIERLLRDLLFKIDLRQNSSECMHRCFL